MSQTGYSKVQIYSSSTATNTPSASNLTNDTNGSELAINITDGKLFYKDNTGTVQVIASKASNSGSFSSVAITGGSINGTTIGSSTASTGAFTTLSASSTVSGTGFSTYLASPPAIGGTTASAGSFTTLSGSTSTTTPIVQSSGSLLLNTNGTTTAVTIDTSQNVGIGVTPSAWYSGYTVAQIGAAGNVGYFAPNVEFDITNNCYRNSSGTWIYQSSSYATIYQSYQGKHIWYNAPSGTTGGTVSLTQAMSLSNTVLGSSTLGIQLTLTGVSTNQTNSTIEVPCTAGVSNGVCAIASTTATTRAFQASNANGAAGYLSISGTTFSLVNLSDYRLKENPQPITTSGAFIDALQPKTWIWKTDGTQGVGFIAHELQEVSPMSADGEKDAVDKDGKPIYQGAAHASAEIIANLVAELQSLRARLKAANIA